MHVPIAITIYPRTYSPRKYHSQKYSIQKDSKYTDHRHPTITPVPTNLASPKKLSLLTT